jgi:hypothetical protein
MDAKYKEHNFFGATEKATWEKWPNLFLRQEAETITVFG